jgi:hypothetical protein
MTHFDTDSVVPSGLSLVLRTQLPGLLDGGSLSLLVEKDQSQEFITSEKSYESQGHIRCVVGDCKVFLEETKRKKKAVHVGCFI